MSAIKQPKVFISYAHLDDSGTVATFWEELKVFLDRPGGFVWEKWDDGQILSGERWDQKIEKALKNDCNCFLLLLSEKYLRSMYSGEKEWPLAVERHEREGVVVIPVAYGYLKNVQSLPADLRELQTYWPRFTDVYPADPAPRPTNVSYRQVIERIDARDRFLSGLADQLNERYAKYSEGRLSMPSPVSGGEIPPLQSRTFAPRDPKISNSAAPKSAAARSSVAAVLIGAFGVALGIVGMALRPPVVPPAPGSPTAVPPTRLTTASARERTSITATEQIPQLQASPSASGEPAREFATSQPSGRRELDMGKRTALAVSAKRPVAGVAALHAKSNCDPPCTCVGNNVVLKLECPEDASVSGCKCSP